jgi:outer membrane protein OmpA-like peptidoglycan-associated protein
MRLTSKFGKPVAGIAAVALMGSVLAGCSTQAMQTRPWGRCAVVGGALGGALGGGGTAGVAYATGPSNDSRTDEAGTGAMIGVLVGTAVGAVIGHYYCDPVVTPPRATPPTTTAAAAPVVSTATVEKLVLRGVHFDFDKSKIRPGDAAVLDEAAATLKANPRVTVNVNGYTDAVGSVKYNQKLSERRAAAVVAYLAKAGIPENQLVPRGYGKTNFVASNDTAEGRAQNRRVELLPVQ